MVVFTETSVILQNEEVTTDIGRNVAEITGKFQITLKPNQHIEDDILAIAISRYGGFDPFSQSFIEIFINNQKLEKITWPFGRTDAIIPEYEDIQRLLFTDGRINEIKVRVASSPVDLLNRWSIYCVYTYNLNTLDPPDEPIEVLPPDIDDDPSKQETECSPFDVQCHLFGDLNKTITTVAIIAGAGIGVYGLAQVVKAVRG